MRDSRRRGGYLLILMALSCFMPSLALAKDVDQDFERLSADFAEGIQGLHIPELALSYVENFHHIQDMSGITAQTDFFHTCESALHAINRRDLAPGIRFQYDWLKYDIEINLERLSLEKSFRETWGDDELPQDGLFRLPDGKRWYALYVKRWTSSQLTPEQLYALGQSEVARVKSAISTLQTQLGYAGRDQDFYRHLNDPSFSITDEAEVIDRLTTLRERILRNLPGIFGDHEVPPVTIMPVPNPTEDTPPGYYEDGVFYFNFYGHSFRRRTLDWLFIHEAIPGHHYQISLQEASPWRPIFAKSMRYQGFIEGWGAYSEDLGKDLGVYQDPYQYLGKWEWDLVRSARLVMDVGLNYFGWSRDQALAYWRAHIPNQDDIARREVDRMIHWPAQVGSYKVGEAKFLELRRRLGLTYDLRRFHDAVLRYGSMPLAILDELFTTL